MIYFNHIFLIQNIKKNLFLTFCIIIIIRFLFFKIWSGPSTQHLVLPKKQQQKPQNHSLINFAVQKNKLLVMEIHVWMIYFLLRNLNFSLNSTKDNRYCIYSKGEFFFEKKNNYLLEHQLIQCTQERSYFLCNNILRLLVFSLGNFSMEQPHVFLFQHNGSVNTLVQFVKLEHCFTLKVHISLQHWY